LGGHAYNYGLEAGTVNAAEVESLKRALEWLESWVAAKGAGAPYAVIYGDSDLTVKFMNR
jgi:ribonuclease HI